MSEARLTINLREQTARRVKRCAKRERRTVSNWLLIVVEKELLRLESQQAESEANNADSTDRLRAPARV